MGDPPPGRPPEHLPRPAGLLPRGRPPGEALQAAVAAAQAWQGTPEVVIHNACCCPFGGVEALDLAQDQAAFATNYYGALQLVRCVGPALRAQGRGRVIFTSSGVGITGFPGLSAYASTKGPWRPWLSA
ncbi:MAG: SDR family NAD(P)-dependent oxidoreductase [Evtepia sp.]